MLPRVLRMTIAARPTARARGVQARVVALQPFSSHRCFAASAGDGNPLEIEPARFQFESGSMLDEVQDAIAQAMLLSAAAKEFLVHRTPTLLEVTTGSGGSNFALEIDLVHQTVELRAQSADGSQSSHRYTYDPVARDWVEASGVVAPSSSATAAASRVSDLEDMPVAVPSAGRRLMTHLTDHLALSALTTTPASSPGSGAGGPAAAAAGAAAGGGGAPTHTQPNQRMA